MAKWLVFNSVCLTFLSVSVYVQSNVHEKRLLLHSETDTVQEIINMKNTIAELQHNFTTLLNMEINKLKAEKTNEVNQLKNEVNTLKNETLQLKLESGNEVNQLKTSFATEINQLKNENEHLRSGSGSTYVRWGRNVCPTSAELVYKGYTAGKHYYNKGSGTDTICLPDDPTWSNYVDGVDSNWSGFVYGTELEVDDSRHIFKDVVHEEDIPCAVCRSKRSTTMMIPGRNSCYGNWTAEYDGYLMSSYNNHYASSYVCVDQSPEFIPGGAQNTNGHLFFLVEARCGALPCPPYVEGRELACVVCSK